MAATLLSAAEMVALIDGPAAAGWQNIPNYCTTSGISFGLSCATEQYAAANIMIQAFAWQWQWDASNTFL